MKNAYAAKLKAKKKQIEHESTKEGFDFALNLCAVALNEKFNFGAERLEVLENEINRIITEEFGSDMEMASYGLAERIKQIRGVK